jgi:methyl-accepting chemotaxis protein
VSTARTKRSRVLNRIILALLVILVVLELATFFIYRGSQDNLVRNSKQQFLEQQTNNLNSSIFYVFRINASRLLEVAKDVPTQQTLEAIANKTLTPIQVYLNSIMKEQVALGFNQIELGLMIPINSIPGMGPFVYASSDEQLIYNWELPAYITDHLDDDSYSQFFEDGVPELGLEGKQLMVMGKESEPTNNVTMSVVVFRPMDEEVAAIDAFYNRETRKTRIASVLLVVVAALIVIAISYLYFSYLIRREITKPIEELEQVAAEVMDGNLEVELEVREGEEFENLKRSFMAMVESIRNVIGRTFGE